MTILSVSSYIPLGDLARIVGAVLVVALIAPSATALGIAGIDRRHAGQTAAGTALLGLGAGILAMLVCLGIYALVNR